MAKKDYKKLASEVIEKVGGMENVAHVTHCMTRLRFSLKDETLIKEEELKTMEGVKGVMHTTDQYQVVIGSDVNKVYDEVMKLGTPGGAVGSAGVNTAVKKDNAPKDIKYYAGAVLDYITGSITPCLPVLVISGMAQAIITILGVFGILDTASAAYTVLFQLSYAGFYYLPMFVGYHAAKKLGMQPLVGGVLGGAMLIPTVMGVEGLSLFGVAVDPSISYAASVFPILITMPVAKLLDMLFDRIIPVALQIVLKDTLVCFITAPIMLLWLAPLGNEMGAGIITGINALNSISPVIAAVVCGTFLPIIVCCGMHSTLIPIMLTICATVGFDSTFMICFLAQNFVNLGATLGVFAKTKNANLKKIALSTAIASATGINEPSYFGVMIPLKKPLITGCIVAGIISLIESFLPMGAISPAPLSFMTLPVFACPQLPMSLALAYGMAVVSIIAGFAAVYVVGFDDSKF